MQTCTTCMHEHSVTQPCLEALSSALSRARVALIEIATETDGASPHGSIGHIRRLARSALGARTPVDTQTALDQAARAAAQMPLLIAAVKGRRIDLAARIVQATITSLASLLGHYDVDLIEVLPLSTCDGCGRQCAEFRSTARAGNVARTVVCAICLASTDDLKERIRERNETDDELFTERRVRATAQIIYGLDGPHVASGTEGDIVSSMLGGEMLVIRWDSLAKHNGFLTPEANERIRIEGIATVSDSVELIEDADVIDEAIVPAVLCGAVDPFGAASACLLPSGHEDETAHDWDSAVSP